MAGTTLNRVRLPIRWSLLLAVLALAAGAGVATGHPADAADVDHDQKYNFEDNCPERFNPKQQDNDDDAQETDVGGQLVYVPPGTPASPPNTTGGDACDVDDDNDAKEDAVDNCDLIANPDQADLDLDDEGDVCDFDDDADGFFDEEDNCPLAANAGQRDHDRDGLGDPCDPDGPKGDPAGALPGFDPNDRTAPAVRIAVRRKRLAAVRSGLVVPVTCSEGCIAEGDLRLGRRTIGTGTAVIHAKGRTFVFVRFAKGALARLGHMRRARTVLVLHVADASGNEATVKHRITLTR